MTVGDGWPVIALFLAFVGGCANGAGNTDLRLELGAQVFSDCGACHLAGGEGVTGIFPPLRNRLSEIAASDPGRDYLIATVLNGLSGPIQVSGTRYAGVMLPHRQSLDDEQISAVLNYIAYELTDTRSTDFRPFLAADVSAARVRSVADAISSLELRRALDIH